MRTHPAYTPTAFPSDPDRDIDARVDSAMSATDKMRVEQLIQAYEAITRARAVILDCAMVMAQYGDQFDMVSFVHLADSMQRLASPLNRRIDNLSDRVM